MSVLPSPWKSLVPLIDHWLDSLAAQFNPVFAPRLITMPQLGIKSQSGLNRGILGMQTRTEPTQNYRKRGRETRQTNEVLPTRYLERASNNCGAVCLDDEKIWSEEKMSLTQWWRSSTGTNRCRPACENNRIAKVNRPPWSYGRFRQLQAGRMRGSHQRPPKRVGTAIAISFSPLRVQVGSAPASPVAACVCLRPVRDPN
jgi:hypothetical protein